MAKLVRALSFLILAVFCIAEATSAQTAPPMPPSSAMPGAAASPHPQGTPLQKKCQKQSGCKKNKKNRKNKKKMASSSPGPMMPTSPRPAMSAPMSTPHPTLPPAPGGTTAPESPIP
jgi:hypothetical protein